MNNKGFTLIELMASIILLSIIMSISTVAVVNLIQASKEKSYDLLIDNIKIGAQEYFEECENINIIESTLPSEACNIIKTENCDDGSKKCAIINLGSLVQYGFLKSSAVEEIEEKEIKIVENPKTNDNMNNCELKISKFTDENKTWYKFKAISEYLYCPSDKDINN